jgi:hypothetical protein
VALCYLVTGDAPADEGLRRDVGLSGAAEELAAVARHSLGVLHKTVPPSGRSASMLRSVLGVFGGGGGAASAAGAEPAALVAPMLVLASEAQAAADIEVCGERSAAMAACALGAACGALAAFAHTRDEMLLRHLAEDCGAGALMLAVLGAAAGGTADEAPTDRMHWLTAQACCGASALLRVAILSDAPPARQLLLAEGTGGTATMQQPGPNDLAAVQSALTAACDRAAGCASAIDAGASAPPAPTPSGGEAHDAAAATEQLTHALCGQLLLLKSASNALARLDPSCASRLAQEERKFGARLALLRQRTGGAALAAAATTGAAMSQWQGAQSREAAVVRAAQRSAWQRLCREAAAAAAAAAAEGMAQEQQLLQARATAPDDAAAASSAGAAAPAPTFASNEATAAAISTTSGRSSGRGGSGDGGGDMESDHVLQLVGLCANTRDPTVLQTVSQTLLDLLLSEVAVSVPATERLAMLSDADKCDARAGEVVAGGSLLAGCPLVATLLTARAPAALLQACDAATAEAAGLLQGGAAAAGSAAALECALSVAHTAAYVAHVLLAAPLSCGEGGVDHGAATILQLCTAAEPAAGAIRSSVQRPAAADTPLRSVAWHAAATLSRLLSRWVGRGGACPPAVQSLLGGGGGGGGGGGMLLRGLVAGVAALARGQSAVAAPVPGMRGVAVALQLLGGGSGSGGGGGSGDGGESMVWSSWLGETGSAPPDGTQASAAMRALCELGQHALDALLYLSFDGDDTAVAGSDSGGGGGGGGIADDTLTMAQLVEALGCTCSALAVLAPLAGNVVDAMPLLVALAGTARDASTAPTDAARNALFGAVGAGTAALARFARAGAGGPLARAVGGWRGTLPPQHAAPTNIAGVAALVLEARPSAFGAAGVAVTVDAVATLGAMAAHAAADVPAYPQATLHALAGVVHNAERERQGVPDACFHSAIEGLRVTWFGYSESAAAAAAGGGGASALRCWAARHGIAAVLLRVGGLAVDAAEAVAVGGHPAVGPPPCMARALSVLEDVSLDRQARPALCAAGVTGQLVALLRRCLGCAGGAALSVAAPVLQTLGNLALDGPAQADLLQAGAAPALRDAVDLARDRLNFAAQAAIDSAARAALAHAATAVRNMALHAPSRAALLGAGVVDALTPLVGAMGCNPGLEEAAASAAQALKYLALPLPAAAPPLTANAPAAHAFSC